MHFVIRAAVVLSTFLTLACGGKSATGPSATVSAVNIGTFVEMLKVRESVAFSATATHSDGSNVAVTQWSSDTPQVATVEATSGKVTGVAPGNVTIIAEHDGMRGTKLVRVVPAFEGRWDGDYSITGCTESGNFGGFCNDLSVGRTLPTTLQFTQNRDAVGGNLSLGQLTAPVQGVMDLAGRLSLADTSILSGEVKIGLTMVRLYIDANDRMQGTFRCTWTHARLTGQGRFDARMRVVVRTSAMGVPAAARHLMPRNWQDLVGAMVVR